VPDARDAVEPPVVHERKLGNGLSVFVVERSAVPLASLELVVRGAGREATTDPRGLAALVAGTLPLGTRLPDGREVSKPSLLGTIPVVSTTEDAAVLALETHTAAVPEAIGLLASLATRPMLSQGGFSNALGDQLDAIANLSRSPLVHLREAALEQLYGRGHPLARPPLGSSAEVRNISLAQLQAFFKARYRPAGSALVVTGAVSAKRVFELAERELGSWSSAAPDPQPEPAPTIIEYGGGRPLVAFTSGSPVTTLLITVPGPGTAGDDWLAFSLAGTALSGLPLSRGNQALSHHDVKSYGVTHAITGRQGSSELVLGFSVEPLDVEDSLATMLNLADSLATQALSPAELERVRASYLAALTESYASNSGCTSLLAARYRAGLPVTDLAGVRARVASVTAADVQQTARRWFTRSRIQIAAAVNAREASRALDRFGRVDWFSLESTVSK
jgi:zinc protease